MVSESSDKTLTENELRVAGVERESIVDGPGIRYVLFVQGCPHHCPGCHNPATHDFNGGYTDTVENIFRDFCENPILTGMTLSGGEPMCRVKPLLKLAKMVRERKKDIVIYTGYTIEELAERAKTEPEVAELLLTARLVVDGPFIEDKRDLSLVFRGSGNQRLLYADDVKKALGEATE